MIINGYERDKDYIQALEEELRKIQVFRRELPLCFHLVTQAIETCKQQFSGPSECSDQTSTDVPVLEEFIPIKRSSDAEQNHSKTDTDNNSMKSDWLRSVQLWNQTPDLPSKEGSARKLRDEKRSTSPVSNGGGIKKEPRRKARRCWSPELHRRFLKALQHLGGSHVATPKQIREVMEVDGLTNDEVKSHLQKYRLYTRRPTPCIQNNKNVAISTQFVVTGGMWVPPKFGTITSEGSNAPRLSKGINSAISAWPQPYHQALGSERQHKPSQLGSGGDESHSSATSSS